MKRLAPWGLLALALLAGCAPYKYRAAPISPAAVAAGLYSRSLDDPDLRTWMQRSAGFETSSWPLRVWDLHSLILAAYYYNPDLDVARANAVAAEAAIKTAAMKPNPAVGLGPGYEGPSSSQFILGFNFSLPIETAGKRGHRVEGATHLSAASRLQRGQTAWVVRSRVRVALVDYLFASQAAALLHKEVLLRTNYVQLTGSRFRAGEIPLPDLITARIELTALRQTLSTAEGQVATAHTALAAAIGVPDSALAGETIVWQAVDAPPAPRALPRQAVRKLAVENRLDVERALEQYRAAQSELQLQVAKQYPDIDLGPGYNFEEGSNFITLALSAVLPLRNHNQGPIAEAEARRKVAGARLLAVQSAVLADTDRTVAQYRAAYNILTDATDAVEELRRQERSADEIASAGETGQLTVVAARLQTSVARRARLTALRQTQLSLGLVEDALERPIGSGTNPALPRTAPRAHKEF